MRSDRDSWLHDALAPARRLEPTDAEIEPVIAAVAARRRRRLSHGVRTFAIALSALLLAGTAAAAATGLIPVGTVIRSAGFQGDDRSVVKETVEATGVSNDVGEWRITTFKSRRGARCLKLTLLDPPARRAPGPSTSGYCGWIGSFSEFGHGRRAAAVARGEVLLFGTAPAAARKVALEGSRDTRISVRTQAASVADRRYWVLAAPVRLKGAELVWRDRRGRARGKLDVSHRFAGPAARTVVATGTTPVGGPWRMTAYESRRLASEGDLYSPEGLPCIELQLLGQYPQRGGSCGVQPRTPGFTRNQASVPNTASRPLESIVFGRAPDRAEVIELRAGGRTISAPTRPAPPGVPGRFWLLARPPEDFANGHVYWVDRDSGARGRPVRLLPP